MKIEINNAHIVDPANGVDRRTSLYICDQSIAAIDHAPAGWNPDRVIDAAGNYLFPGLIDIGTRLREPGQEHKATIASETLAAVSGGITSVVCLPDTNPPVDSPAEVELIQQRTLLSGHCHVYVIGALTTQLQGSMLSEMAALKEAGYAAFEATGKKYVIVDWWDLATPVCKEVYGQAGGHAGCDENGYILALDPNMVKPEDYLSGVPGK